MKKWRRVITLAGLSLMCGVVVTVLLAESVGVRGAAYADLPAPTLAFSAGKPPVVCWHEAGAGWERLEWRATRPAASTAGLDDPARLPAWSCFWSADGRPIESRSNITEVAVGWPLVALSINWELSAPEHARGGKVLANHANGHARVLALRPIVHGLLLDSLIYSAALAVLRYGVVFAMRRWRRSRGGCVTCGYDRRGLASASAPCPECGAAPAVAAAG